MKDFQQHVWGERLERVCRTLIRLALSEDLDGQQDWTTMALVPPERGGKANIVARAPGIAAGLPTIRAVLEEANAEAEVTELVNDGDQFSENTVLARLEGNVRHLLICERTILNLLGRLSGIATLTGKYVEKVAGTIAKVYDTRKTTPGWRRLEKYAVHCGGGKNHRTGLFDAILIKDNHLAQWLGTERATPETTATAVRAVHQFLQSQPQLENLPVEVEVDTLEQLTAVLPAQPDLVLLDNMTAELLQRAVQLRNELAPNVKLEASGGVTLESLRQLAESGVDRISVGALTHSVGSLDVGLDWLAE